MTGIQPEPVEAVIEARLAMLRVPVGDETRIVEYDRTAYSAAMVLALDLSKPSRFGALVETLDALICEVAHTREAIETERHLEGI